MALRLLTEVGLALQRLTFIVKGVGTPRGDSKSPGVGAAPKGFRGFSRGSRALVFPERNRALSGLRGNPKRNLS